VWPPPAKPTTQRAHERPHHYASFGYPASFAACSRCRNTSKSAGLTRVEAREEHVVEERARLGGVVRGRERRARCARACSRRCRSRRRAAGSAPGGGLDHAHAGGEGRVVATQQVERVAVDGGHVGIALQHEVDQRPLAHVGPSTRDRGRALARDVLEQVWRGAL